jgi:hypothetical protein
MAALVRVLEGKGHFTSAATLLRRLLRHHPEAEIAAEEGGKVRVRDFAEGRLKAGPYLRAPGEAPPADLRPPLKLDYSTTDREFPEGVPLLPGGVPPPAAADLVLMHYASPGSAAVKALGAGGREAWAVRLEDPLRFAVHFQEGLLLAGDFAVRRLDPRSGRVEWTWESPTRMRGFGVSGPYLFFFSGAPGAEVDQQVSALDALRGTLAWVQPFDGVPSGPVHPAGEAVAFTTVSPNRIRVFDVETGQALTENAPYSLGLTARTLHVAEDVLILHAEGRFLEAFDLPKGALRWRVALERLTTRGAAAAGDRLVLLGVQHAGGRAEEKLLLQTYSIRSGKLLQRREARDLADPRSLMAAGDRGFVVSREADGGYAARGLSLEDLSVLWKAPVAPATASPLPPSLALNHLVTGFFEPGPDGRFAFGAALLDKAGTAVQNIRSDFRFERPPEMGVAGSRLMFSSGAMLDVYR